MKKAMPMFLALAALAASQWLAQTTQAPTGTAHKPGATHKAATSHTAPAAKAVTTPSGLKYVDLLVGKGPAPKDGDTVLVH